MRICPVELELCDRAECSRGHCELSAEQTLTPCHGCGALVVYRRFVVCVECARNEETVKG